MLGMLINVMLLQKICRLCLGKYFLEKGKKFLVVFAMLIKSFYLHLPVSIHFGSEGRAVIRIGESITKT